MAKQATLDRRDPDYLARWMAGLQKGFQNALRCTAKRRDGEPCRLPRMRGSNRCPRHCTGKERDKVDQAAYPRLQCTASNNSSSGDRARTRLAAIERRRLRRAWQKDPTLEGSTIALSASDEKRVDRYLMNEHSLDLSGLCALTGRPFTPSAQDRLRWCAVHALSGRISQEAAAVRVKCILTDEQHFFERLHTR